LKILDDIAWFKGKFVYLSYFVNINLSIIPNNLPLVDMKKPSKHEIPLKLIYMKDEGLMMTKWRMQKTRDLLAKEDFTY
jgi:hypothetical protein